MQISIGVSKSKTNDGLRLGLIFIIRFILVLHQNVSLANLNSFQLAVSSCKADASACYIIAESIWADTVELRKLLQFLVECFLCHAKTRC